MNRFWNKVNKTNGCWLWTAMKVNRNKETYGRFWFHGKLMLAHRMAWELTNGPIPEGLDVLHKCDTPLCVRPEHLFLGTMNDNIQDAITKGKINGNPMYRGESRYNHKVNESQVKEIRNLRANGLSWEKLAVQFGMSSRGIRNICNGHSWRWL